MTRSLRLSNASLLCNRREALIGIAATAGAVVVAPCALAGGGGGGGGDGGQNSAPNQNENTQIKKKGRPTIQTQYSQSQFTRLSADQIHHINDQISIYRKRITIDGFSYNMGTFIIDMAAWHRRRTQSLVREMKRIKDMDKRKARLQREIDWAEREKAKLEESLERARKMKLKSAISETRVRIDDAKDYLKGLRIWYKYPHEGTRE